MKVILTCGGRVGERPHMLTIVRMSVYRVGVIYEGSSQQEFGKLGRKLYWKGISSEEGECGFIVVG